MKWPYLDGRRIVPIRAIPAVSGPDLPPDEIVAILAEREPRWRSKVTIRAHSLDEDGVSHPIPPGDWDVVLRDLLTLRKSLEAKQMVSDEPHPLWRTETIRRIPAGAFVWWDELDRLHEDPFPKHTRQLLYRRGGDLEIDINPPLSKEEINLILEGFEPLALSYGFAVRENSATEFTSNDVREVLALTKWVAGAILEALKNDGKSLTQRSAYARKRAKTKRQHQRLQKEADRLWAQPRHANSTKSQIAEIIARSEAGARYRPNTIRQIIKKKS